MEMPAFDFQHEVIAASAAQPVLVDFWAPWCGPCRVLGPVLERLAANAHGQWTLVKVNTEEHPQLAMEYRISSIPAVKLFHRGKVIAEFAGALPESQIARWLVTHIPSPGDDSLEKAKQALDNGDRQRARELFKEALALDDSQMEAKVRLAELQFAEDPAGAVAMVADLGEGAPMYDHAAALRELYHAWNLKPDSVDTGSRAWPLFEKGCVALREGNYDAAAEAWINALRLDRKWEEDAARRACVALFRWLGEQHPVTQAHRRSFSSALF